jgi:nicotinamide riboside kinase
MKKVLITGTIGSGKSSLISVLRSKLPHSVVVVQQVARFFREEHSRHQPQVPLTEDDVLQTLFFQQQVAFERAAALYQPDLVLCDGGVLDNIAYARLFSLTIQSEWIEWCRGYDAIFLFDKRDIPFTLSLTSALMPPQDWVALRENLDDHLKHALRTYKLPYYFISGTLEERVMQMENYLR